MKKLRGVKVAEVTKPRWHQIDPRHHHDVGTKIHQSFLKFNAAIRAQELVAIKAENPVSTACKRLARKQVHQCTLVALLTTNRINVQLQTWIIEAPEHLTCAISRLDISNKNFVKKFGALSKERQNNIAVITQHHNC